MNFLKKLKKTDVTDRMQSLVFYNGYAQHHKSSE